ncbi:sigma-54 interaction domain-containing protein [Methylotuvimicrobium alcaliphilum]|uniref:Transcriptional Regulator, Fis family n=1 Tax=Methylotuvimicrobium alcaliphilum (strain DSM 19304 / NCIMB 14124 / VKM B-2133 / 20Z) TaxID=1091494 RepID=G4SYA2_META2|nr:sigma 54-interacting transcriptional regulator [Methylotuvimicrobium alcaliphilum]CCE25411.1 putative Transcriptional Regulator, Fis family [Methylotuvimicrobium alcaliphilum 20Z]
MQINSFTLNSLLETHDLPFIIVNAAQQIVGVNRAWENHFGQTRESILGNACCNNPGDCRHRRFFQTLEPYAGLFSDTLDEREYLLKVRGYPLLDTDGTLYLGESVLTAGASEPQDKSPKMVGTSSAFINLKSNLQKAAQSNVPVMLNGETGTGKELAAEFIHRQSQNADGEFVIVDCTVLGEDLFESELFGHEKGSFTGAASAKKGLFELADGGTLFLDEVGELPVSLQPKLLRALESGQFRRVGGTTSLTSTVRVVTATHRNLGEMVRNGLFREDLFYRLSVFPLEIPALRDRIEDMPALVGHFLKSFGQRDCCVYSTTKAAMQKLMQHKWPGNIRELKNCLQLATCLCKNHTIDELDISIMRRQGATLKPGMIERRGQGAVIEDTGASNINPLDTIEAEFIRSLIKKYQGNRKLIASEMNISERTLYRKLNRLNIN